MLPRTIFRSESDPLSKPSPLVVGKVTAHHGLKGWVKISSYTRPVEHIGEYASVLLGRGGASRDWQRFRVSDYRLEGTPRLAKIENWVSREDAQNYIGCLIAIDRHALPALEEGEYYWADLLDCEVTNKSRVVLGRITDIMETGANDVLVVRQDTSDRRETLVPWIADAVLDIDLKRRCVLVDWHEDD